MTAFTDLSDVVNKATGGNSGTPENLFFHKVARIAGVVAPATITGRATSLWTYDGQPGAGAAPGAVAIPTNATAGGLEQVNPGGARQKFLTTFMATCLTPGTLVLYDRLLHISGLNGTTATAQTVQAVGPTPPITRYTNGLGNFAMAEIYTTIGTSATTISMSYINQAGATQTSPATTFGGTAFREQARAILLPLVSGDNGVQAVRTVTHATTGTVGNYGITIGHPLASVTIGSAGIGNWRDFLTGLPGVPEILPNACLAMLFIAGATTAPEFFGCASMLES